MSIHTQDPLAHSEICRVASAGAKWPTDPRSCPLRRRAAGLGACHADAGMAVVDADRLERLYATQLAAQYAPRLEHVVRAYRAGYAFRLENPL